MKVFIAGPRVISKLTTDVKERLMNIYNKNFSVVVGDASGVDKAIQQYFYELKYPHVNVFASRGRARNNIGKWTVQGVEVPSHIKGFEFYAAKDLKMAEYADYGFMIWNGKSRGTLNNMINLLNMNKKTLLYFIPKKEFYCINNYNKLNEIIDFCDETTRTLYDELNHQYDKISLFESD